MTTASLLPWTTALTLKASPVINPASGCSLAKRAAAASTSCSGNAGLRRSPESSKAYLGKFMSCG